MLLFISRTLCRGVIFRMMIILIVASVYWVLTMCQALFCIDSFNPPGNSGKWILFLSLHYPRGTLKHRVSWLASSWRKCTSHQAIWLRAWALPLCWAAYSLHQDPKDFKADSHHGPRDCPKICGWPPTFDSRPNTRYLRQKSGFKQAAAGGNVGCVAGRQEQMGTDSERMSV